MFVQDMEDFRFGDYYIIEELKGVYGFEVERIVEYQQNFSERKRIGIFIKF